MANFFKVKNGINIASGGTPSASGDLSVSANRLQFHNGTSASNVVLTDSTDTLTNKTLSSPVLTGSFSFPVGSAASPSIAFTGDTNTGIYSDSADEIWFSNGGSGSFRFYKFSGTTPTIQARNSSASPFNIITSQSNAAINIAADSGIDSSRNITLYGSAHASKANQLEIKRNSTVDLSIDSSGFVTLNSLTASRVLVSNSSKQIVSTSTTDTEIGYLSGVTSAIQTQLDAKTAKSTLTTKGDIYVATASATPARLAVGTDSQILSADSSTSTGLKWISSPTANNSYLLENLGLSTSVAANALTIALKQANGSSDPSTGTSAVRIGFRNATATSGAYNLRSVTSSLSMTVSSGSTLGHQSGVASYIYVYALDNSGTVELAVSSVKYDEGSIVSTTAEGGAGGADSNRLIYSTTARSNVPIRLIGRLLSTQATAGTWASAMSEVSLASAIKPTERVFVKYQNNGGQSVGIDGVVTFSSKVIDSHNAWDGTTFTAPKTGVYLINGLSRTSSNSTVIYYIAVDDGLTNKMNTNADTDQKNLIGMEYLTAGQTLKIKADRAITLFSDASTHWVSIYSAE